MKIHDNTYLDLVRRIFENGINKTDRTGTGTTSLPFQQMRFDLSDNSLPLLTTKLMHTKSIIHELLWFLQGNTSSDELERNNVRIWKEWKDENGELGKIYGHQWRNWDIDDRLTFVTPITISSNIPTKLMKKPLLTPNVDYDDAFIGTKHNTNECGTLVVINLDSKDSKGDHKYTIQFKDTGYTKHDVRKSTINRGCLIDYYLPRVYGVGWLGDYDKDDPSLKQLQRHWYKILERCYDSSIPEYQLYGGDGVFVHPDWHCFAKFQHDVKYIPNWSNKRIAPYDYQLDKDYYGSKCYSKQTCVWLTTKHNTLYRKNPRPFVMTSPDGNETTKLSVADTALEIDGNIQGIYSCLHNKRNHHKGYKFTYADVPSGQLARYKLPIDQIAIMVNQLRNDPTSRRIILNAWNVGELDKMALPPCHAFFQCWSDGKELRTHLYQRSCDVGLGVPFNIAQYSILTHMLAQVTGLQATEFVWTGGDVHIYKNHYQQLTEQLDRSPYQSPTLKLNSEVKEIDDFKFEDFSVEGYKSHPTIKMKVSV